MTARLAFIACLALAVPTAWAKLVTRNVDYVSDGVTMQGYLAYDTEKVGKTAPLVLVVHDWDGLNEYERMRARMIAELGYVAFAVDVYGRGVRPVGPEACRAEAVKYYADYALFRQRLRAGLEAARALEHVDATRVAAIGYCFGGAGALELARSGADVRGVVSFHGSLLTPSPAKKDQVRAEILVLHGGADPHVPAAHVTAFRREMEAAGARYQVVEYAGAKHSFTVKDSEKSGAQGVGYDENADRLSWRAMRSFLLRLFR